MWHRSLSMQTCTLVSLVPAFKFKLQAWLPWCATRKWPRLTPKPVMNTVLSTKCLGLLTETSQLSNQLAYVFSIFLTVDGKTLPKPFQAKLLRGFIIAIITAHAPYVSKCWPRAKLQLLQNCGFRVDKGGSRIKPSQQLRVRYPLTIFKREKNYKEHSNVKTHQSVHWLAALTTKP